MVEAVQSAFVDGDGHKMGPADTLEFLATDILTKRTAQKEQDSPFREWVRLAVQEDRRAAGRGRRLDAGDTFSIANVLSILKCDNHHRRSLHLPQRAVSVTHDFLLLLTWAIVNLAAALGVTSKLW